MKLIAIFFISIFGTMARADVSPTFQAEGSDGISPRFRSQYLAASGGFRAGTQEIQLGGFQLQRDYTDANFTESGLFLQGIGIFDGGYWTARAQQSSNVVTFPKWKVFAEARWFISQGEIGLGISQAEYEGLNASGVRPVITLWPEGPWRVDAAVDSVFIPQAIVAAQLRITRPFSDHWFFQLGGAGGETLEDATLVVRFQQISAAVLWKSGHYEVNLTTARSWSTTREENIVSVGLGVRP